MASNYKNALLSAMSPADRDLLDLEGVSLADRERLEEPRKPVTHVYFLESGIAAILYRAHGDEQAEIALIGHEGCTGCSVILGVDLTPQGTTMQVGGEAYRTPTPTLWQALKTSEPLRRLLNHYVHTVIIQRDETALSASKGTVVQRLARWLIMCHDRLPGENVELTHDLISVMLGVRRAGVTTAIGELAQLGLIERGRKNIHIINIDGLKQIAHPFYGAPQAEAERLYGRAAEPAR